LREAERILDLDQCSFRALKDHLSKYEPGLCGKDRRTLRVKPFIALLEMLKV